MGKKQIELKDIQIGDLFSEESHYIVTKINNNYINFKHLESDKGVSLDIDYVKDLLCTADQVFETKEVTKEDKLDGTLGIRSIFEGLKSSQVFTVIFTKQNKTKSKKAVTAELTKQREEAVEIIEKAKRQKKSMAKAYEEALTHVQNNPVTTEIPGESRKLRGYKIQFTSRDGKYNCVDVDLKFKGESNYIRPVNINTITDLFVNGIHYKVE